MARASPAARHTRQEGPGYTREPAHTATKMSGSKDSQVRGSRHSTLVAGMRGPAEHVAVLQPSTPPLEGTEHRGNPHRAAPATLGRALPEPPPPGCKASSFCEVSEDNTSSSSLCSGAPFFVITQLGLGRQHICLRDQLVPILSHTRATLSFHPRGSMAASMATSTDTLQQDY